MSFTQENRRLQIETPLGSDVVQLVRFEGTEEISSLFRYDLELVSTEGAIDAKQIVGKRVSFAVEMPNEGVMRWFDGFVRQFSYLGQDDRQHHYRAEVVPALWFATQTSDCRIFQDMTIQEIVKEVLGSIDSIKFEFSGIALKHPKWENCTQYRESDFAFVSRLLEQEGLFYYFKHEQGSHTMVISDSRRSYFDCIESEVNFASSLAAPDPYDQITAWEHRYEFRNGKSAVNDYNFKTPSTPLSGETTSIVKYGGNTDLELYAYPAEVDTKEEAEADARLRMEEHELSTDLIVGKSKCRSFTPGGKFKISEHHNPGESGKSYVVTAIRHIAHMGGSYSSGDSSEEVTYENQFTAIPSSVVYRPSRQTPKPTVRGVQTAVVVGNPQEEIQTDQYGRVRVQFHWDRYGRKVHDASCWIRVATPWAGNKYGVWFLPRVGHEVVVTFVEGDPDRPLVIGSVYNPEHELPYAQPEFKDISTIKTMSHPSDSGGFNELRFVDKKGEEQIFIHGQRNFDVRIRNCMYETVYGNREERIGWEKDGASGGCHNILVKEDVNHHVKKQHYELVEKKQQVQVLEDAWFGYEKNLVVMVTDKIETNAKKYILETSQQISEKSGKITIEGTMSVSMKGAMLNLESTTGISIKCGGSSVVIDPSGVTIKGPTVTIDGGMTRINSGPGSPPKSADAAESTGNYTIEEPIDAEVADDATPGKQGKGAGGSRARKSRTYNSQHPPAAPPPTVPGAPAGGGTPPPPPPPVPACTGCSATSQTISTQPANRARTTVGVGEEVDLDGGSGACAVTTWTLSGPGRLSTTSGSTTRFTAADRAGSATITGTCSHGTTTTITFTVVEPSGLRMRRADASGGNGHTVNRPDSGMRLEIFLLPDTVCFYNVDWSELDCPCAASGVYAAFNGVGHDANASSKAFSGSQTVVSGFGTKMNALDHAYSGDTGLTAPFTPGQLQFNIPNRFKVGTGAWKNFTTNVQTSSLAADGNTLATTKGTATSRPTTLSTASYTV